MIEIQCTSCQTRYRIDERILPDETPTFKCSRCGHVFSAEPRERPPLPRKPEQVNLRAAEPAPEAAVRPRAGGGGAAADAARSAAEAVRSAETSARAESAAAKAAVAVTEPERPAESPGDPGWRTGHEPGGGAEGDPGEDRFARPFDERSEAAPGETMTFDFSEDRGKSGELPEIPVAAAAHEWKVGGEDDPADRSFAKAVTDDEPDVEEYPRGIIDVQPEPQDRRSRRPAAGTVHSAGLFIGVFGLVAFGFGLLSLLLCGAPAASAGLLSRIPLFGASFAPPMSPAKRIALVDVNGQYARLKDGQAAFIVSGAADNVSDLTLHAVQIEAALIGVDRQVARQTVYCGNNLSLKMVAEMTQHELEFFQKLDPPKSFALAASESAPFVVVFIAPPPSATRFQVRVAQAGEAADEAAASDSADSSGDDATPSP